MTREEVVACEAELEAYSDYLASNAPDAVSKRRQGLLRRWNNVRKSGGEVPDHILQQLEEQHLVAA